MRDEGQKVTLPTRARWPACRETDDWANPTAQRELRAPVSPAREPGACLPSQSRYTRAALTLIGCPPEPVTTRSAVHPLVRKKGPPAGSLTKRHAPAPARAWVPLNLSEWYSGTAGTASAPSLIPGAAAIFPDGRGAPPVRDRLLLCSHILSASRATAQSQAAPTIPLTRGRTASWASRPYLSGRCPGGAGVRVSSRRSRASHCINPASRRQNFTQGVSSHGRRLPDQEPSLLGTTVKPTANIAKPASVPKTGLVALLGGLLRVKGTRAPVERASQGGDLKVQEAIADAAPARRHASGPPQAVVNLCVTAPVEEAGMQPLSPAAAVSDVRPRRRGAAPGRGPEGASNEGARRAPLYVGGASSRAAKSALGRANGGVRGTSADFSSLKKTPLSRILPVACTSLKKASLCHTFRVAGPARVRVFAGSGASNHLGVAGYKQMGISNTLSQPPSRPKPHRPQAKQAISCGRSCPVE